MLSATLAHAQISPTAMPTPPPPSSERVQQKSAALSAPQNLQVSVRSTPWPLPTPIPAYYRNDIMLTWDAVEGAAPVTYPYAITGPVEQHSGQPYSHETIRSVTWIRPFVSDMGGTAEDGGKPPFATTQGEFTWSVQANDNGDQSGEPGEATFVMIAVTATPTPLPENLPNPDIDGDGEVESKDVLIFSSHWLATLNTETFPQRADLNVDGQIDALDLRRFREAESETALPATAVYEYELRADPYGFVTPGVHPVEGNPSLTIVEIRHCTFRFQPVAGAVQYLVEFAHQTGEESGQPVLTRRVSPLIGDSAEIRFPIEDPSMPELSWWSPTSSGTYTITITPISSTWRRGASSQRLWIELK